jgi:outer membrane immunogenic protein
VEYAFLPNWSAKIEYNFMDFGRKDISFADPFDPPESFGFGIKQQLHAVKFGINYRFGGAPLVANY